jgi:hypothetical protein
MNERFKQRALMHQDHGARWARASRAARDAGDYEAAVRYQLASRYNYDRARFAFFWMFSDE